MASDARSPRVSVIIPTRDNLDVLPKALESVWAQPVDGMEVIVVDDGSKDGAGEWLASLAAREPRLQVLSGGGRGAAGARNLALAAARAPLLSFLDADDWWHPGKLARQLAWHERTPEAAFSFTDYLQMDPAGGSLGTCFDYWRPPYRFAVPHSYRVVADAEAQILGANTVGTSTVMASAAHLAAAGGFSAALPSAEDWDLWLRLAGRGPVGCSSMVTASYLVRPGSETSKRAARLAAMETIVAPFRDRPEPAVQAALRLADGRIAQARAELARERGDSWAALRFDLHAMLAAPSLRSARSAAAAAAHSVLGRASRAA